jgi:hypothetical protein
MDLRMAAMTSGLVDRESVPVTMGRLWAGVLLAPAAWVVAELLGYPLASRGCDQRTVSAAARTGVTQDVIAVVLALIAVAGLVIAMGNWRQARAAASSNETAARGRAQFMSLAGVVASALFTLGIVFFALPPLLINICREVR